MNRVNLVGRIANDLELRFTPNGKAVCQFSLAVKKPYKVKEGEKDVDFFRIVAWGKAAENLAQYNKKGYYLAVDGSLKNRTYEKDGQMKYLTEVIAEYIHFIGKTEAPDKKEEIEAITEDLDIDAFDDLVPFIEEN